MSNDLTTQPQTESAALVATLARAAADPSVNPEKMSALMDLMERAQARQSKQVYTEAMAACQAEMRPISQDASNPQTRSKYASYGALDNALRPVYTKHGLAISFDTEETSAETVTVIAIVTHKNGHEERRKLKMPADGKGAKGGDVMTKTHATMSAVSYGRRGLLKMVFNIAEGEYDDDGNGATGRGPMGNITVEQRDTLAKIIEDNGFPIDTFLKWAQVETLADLPAANYQKAHNALMSKVQAKRAAK